MEAFRIYFAYAFKIFFDVCVISCIFVFSSNIYKYSKPMFNKLKLRHFKLFNMRGEEVDHLKTVIVAPILKPNEATECAKYSRPISLLS